jgi:hypothetical protein
LGFQGWSDGLDTFVTSGNNDPDEVEVTLAQQAR